MQYLSWLDGSWCHFTVTDLHRVLHASPRLSWFSVLIPTSYVLLQTLKCSAAGLHRVSLGACSFCLYELGQPRNPDSLNEAGHSYSMANRNSWLPQLLRETCSPCVEGSFVTSLFKQFHLQALCDPCRTLSFALVHRYSRPLYPPPLL